MRTISASTGDGRSRVVRRGRRDGMLEGTSAWLTASAAGTLAGVAVYLGVHRSLDRWSSRGCSTEHVAARPFLNRARHDRRSRARTGRP